MKQLKIIGLSLLALLALGAFAASSASAVEGVLPLNKKGFNVLGGVSKLETSEATIECKELLSSKGTMENDVHGTATLDWLGCSASGFLAFSLGEKEPKEVKEALILAKVLVLICLINSASLIFGVYVELDEPVHIHIPTLFTLVVVTGAVIGEVLTKGLAKLFVGDFVGSKGVQNVKECKDEAGGVKKHSLTSSTNGGAAKPASENVEKGLVQFEEAQELMDK
jgi:hypothetical protein